MASRQAIDMGQRFVNVERNGRVIGIDDMGQSLRFINLERNGWDASDCVGT